MLSPLYLRFDNGHLPSPADSTGGRHRALNQQLLSRSYRVMPTVIGLNTASSQYDRDTLIDPPATPQKPADLPAVTSRNMESSRMALLKSGPWQVFFHYGQLTRAHAQSEALNYELFYDGVDISHDTGTVGYGSPMHRGYYTQGINHNVPLINGEGQPGPWPANPGVLLAFSENPPSVTAKQPDYQPGVLATRKLEILDDAFVDTTTVSAPGETPQQIGLSLHVQGRVTLPDTFEADPDFANNRPAAFKHWKNPKKGVMKDRATFPVNFGKLTLSLTIETPGEFTVWHAETPDTSPGVREGFYVETTGNEVQFLTIFQKLSP